jgi:hypothetical protein
MLKIDPCVSCFRSVVILFFRVWMFPVFKGLYFMIPIIVYYNIFYFDVPPFFPASEYNDPDLKLFSYVTGRLASMK